MRKCTTFCLSRLGRARLAPISNTYGLHAKLFVCGKGALYFNKCFIGWVNLDPIVLYRTTEEINDIKFWLQHYKVPHLLLVTVSELSNNWRVTQQGLCLIRRIYLDLRVDYLLNTEARERIRRRLRRRAYDALSLDPLTVTLNPLRRSVLSNSVLDREKMNVILE